MRSSSRAVQASHRHTIVFVSSPETEKRKFGFLWQYLRDSLDREIGLLFGRQKRLGRVGELRRCGGKKKEERTDQEVV